MSVRRVRSAARFAAALAVVFAAACDTTAPSGAASIVLVNHDSISGTVGQPVAAPVEFLIRDERGNLMHGIPLSGIPFAVTITGGGGSLTGTPATTSHGSTSIGVWTLGTIAGPNTLTVTSSVFPPLTIVATAAPGPPAHVAAIGPITGRALSGVAPLSPTVRVTDAFGNAVPGVAVSVTVGAGSGTVATPNPVTDAAGVATVGTWTLGTLAGTQTVTMTVAQLPPVVFSVLTEPFNVTVRFVGPPPSAAIQAAFTAAANRIQQAITFGVPDVPLVNFSSAASCGEPGFPVLNETIDDVLILAEVVPIDGIGGVLGQSGPCEVRASNGIPYLGIVQFDIADVNAMVANGTFNAVVLHEFHHTLGFGTIWFASPPTPTLLSGINSPNPIFTGVNARAEYVTAGGTSVLGVPVEAGGGSGTALAHWRESVFHDELMTGFLTGATQPYSRMTIASLADLGYAVAYTTADPYTVLPPGQLRASISASDVMTLKEILIHPRAGHDLFGRPWTTPARDTMTITMRKPPGRQ